MSSKMEASKNKSDLLEQLLIYVIQSFTGLLLFGLFYAASVIAYWISNLWPEISIMMMVRIVSWIILTLGAICCIALVVRNTIVFIRFLFKGSLRETFRKEAADEGRDQCRN